MNANRTLKSFVFIKGKECTYKHRQQLLTTKGVFIYNINKYCPWQTKRAPLIYKRVIITFKNEYSSRLNNASSNHHHHHHYRPSVVQTPLLPVFHRRSNQRELK